MTQAMATTISRRSWFSRVLMAAAVAPVVGVRLADSVHAGKKKKKAHNITLRVEAERLGCEFGNPEHSGTLVEQQHEDGTVTTECKGGDLDGRTCFHGKTKTKCHQQTQHVPTTNVTEGAVPATAGADPSGGTAGTDPSGGTTTGGDRPWLSDPPILEPAPGDGSDPVLE